MERGQPKYQLQLEGWCQIWWQCVHIQQEIEINDLLYDCQEGECGQVNEVQAGPAHRFPICDVIVNEIGSYERVDQGVDWLCNGNQ